MKQTIYLGPDIKGIVRKNQIFIFWPEDVIRRACEVNMLAKHLFVSMEDVVQSRNELRRQDSFLFLAYQKVKKGK